MKANRKGSDGEVDIENIRERKDNKQYTVLEKGRREGAKIQVENWSLMKMSAPMLKQKGKSRGSVEVCAHA